MVQLFAITVIAIGISASFTGMEQHRIVREMDAKASALATTLDEALLKPYRAKAGEGIAEGKVRAPRRKLSRNLSKTAARLRLKQGITALALCPAPGTRGRARIFPDRGPSLARWPSLKDTCSLEEVGAAARVNEDQVWTRAASGPGASGARYLAHPIGPHGRMLLVVVQDLATARAQRLPFFLHALALFWCAGLVLLLLGRALRPRAAGARGAAGELVRIARLPFALPVPFGAAGHGGPHLPNLANLANLEEARVASLREAMRGRELVVIANREPYIHQRRGDQVSVVRPASGLVAALEPILRQCGGLWIAHGSGDADVETANDAGEVAVPPGNPTYTLRRVWLSREQESGYYYGFSNEGLWPLCHLAHNRPTFRLADWRQYQAVNQKFRDSIPPQILEGDSTILVQDYHFALLPRMIRDSGAPRARVALFWHIPWPNPEAFGILPWSEELLRGMLGADVIGFHTQYHCNNFLETCDRYLEARIDWEKFSVTMENRETLIRAFPIGIDTAPVKRLTDEARAQLRASLGITAEYVAIGVDRLDYTKGIVERIEAVERFLEKYPQYVGRFTLVQVGSPSRTQIGAYRALAEKLEALAARVNARFAPAGGDTYRPVLLIPEHHEREQIEALYQLGDTCMVTSLHDGMNLVAKEYVWCQRPERGSLILSKFTGASRELTEAFIVNPYSSEEMADALATALALSPEERAARMSAMREKVRRHDAYHWAADLIHAVVKSDESVITRLSRRDPPGRWKSARASG